MAMIYSPIMSPSNIKRNSTNCEIQRKQSTNPKDGKYRDRHILHSDFKFKVILLGDINVGKQTLMNKFTKEEENIDEDNIAFHKTKVGKGKFDYVHVMVDDQVVEVLYFYSIFYSSFYRFISFILMD